MVARPQGVPLVLGPELHTAGPGLLVGGLEVVGVVEGCAPAGPRLSTTAPLVPAEPPCCSQPTLCALWLVLLWRPGRFPPSSFSEESKSEREADSTRTDCAEMDPSVLSPSYEDDFLDFLPRVFWDRVT